MRTLDVQYVGDRQIEIAVVVRQSGEACASDGYAVVRLAAADNLLLRRTSEGIVVIPDQFDDRVVGFRS